MNGSRYLSLSLSPTPYSLRVGTRFILHKTLFFDLRLDSLLVRCKLRTSGAYNLDAGVRLSVRAFRICLSARALCFHLSNKSALKLPLFFPAGLHVVYFWSGNMFKNA